MVEGSFYKCLAQFIVSSNDKPEYLTVSEKGICFLFRKIEERRGGGTRNITCVSDSFPNQTDVNPQGLSRPVNARVNTTKTKQSTEKYASNSVRVCSCSRTSARVAFDVTETRRSSFIPERWSITMGFFFKLYIKG